MDRFPKANDEAWRIQAACADTNPNLFFPKGKDEKLVAAAKEVCDSCVVVTECFNYAVETGQNDGIWGGTTEEERRQMRREIREQAVKIS